jgi:hypothetical protein
MVQQQLGATAAAKDDTLYDLSLEANETDSTPADGEKYQRFS